MSIPGADNKGKPAQLSSAAADQATVIKFKKGQVPENAVLPSLFGAGQGIYEVRPENFVLSVVTHTVALGLLLWLLHTIPAKIQKLTGDVTLLTAPILRAGPDSGGGDRSKLQPTAGKPPKAARQQLAPVTLRPQESKLMVQPTVVADLKLPGTSQVGDPLSKLVTGAGGPGSGGGVGRGSGGGIGDGSGPMCCGSGVSEPKPIYTPEPEFSEEARKAKYQGVVSLLVVVGTDGRIHNPKVVRSLGMGLDEKALEIVKVWKFDPAKKDNRAVAVQMVVEVDFHLY